MIQLAKALYCFKSFTVTVRFPREEGRTPLFIPPLSPSLISSSPLPLALCPHLFPLRRQLFHYFAPEINLFARQVSAINRLLFIIMFS